MSKKKLLISIDPGFDGCKVCVNGTWWDNIPFIAKKVDNEVDLESVVDDAANYIFYSNEMGKYLVGSFAKKSIWGARDVSNEERHSLDNFYKVHDRFTSDRFKVVVEAALGYSLVRYEEATKKSEAPFSLAELQDYDIHLALALPHEHAASIWTSIRSMVYGPHTFNLTVGVQKPRKFDITIKEGYAASQAKSTFYDALFGFDGKHKYSTKELAPAVVILAGYKTLERFEYTASGEIVAGDDKNTSNEEFAMFNINQQVARRIKENYPNANALTEYEIEAALYSGKESINLKVKNGDDIELVAVPIAEYRKEELKEVCARMIKDTQKNFDYFANTNTILVAGGTGSLYYEYIKEWCDKQEALKDKCILVTGENEGKKYEPVFSVVMGLWKMLKYCMIK